MIPIVVAVVAGGTLVVLVMLKNPRGSVSYIIIIIIITYLFSVHRFTPIEKCAINYCISTKASAWAKSTKATKSCKL